MTKKKSLKSRSSRRRTTSRKSRRIRVTAETRQATTQTTLLQEKVLEMKDREMTTSRDLMEVETAPAPALLKIPATAAILQTRQETDERAIEEISSVLSL
jgi:hypothetical protein